VPARQQFFRHPGRRGRPSNLIVMIAVPKP
jgi:hypothetical protein